MTGFKMGCLTSTHESNNEESFDTIDEPIAAVSYHRRSTKVRNQLKSDNIIRRFSKNNRKAKKKLNTDVLTPSKIDYDVDCISIISGAIDLEAITDTHKHWRFPKWGHHGKCSFCGHSNHNMVLRHNSVSQSQSSTKGNNLETLIKKQNNQRMPPLPSLPSTGGMCAMAFANLLAMNALDLTAPASDALLKNRKNAWVQLAGHPGSFAPAGPHTIWKKRMTNENNETFAYQSMMADVVATIVPKFYREVDYNGDFFIEMEDLLQNFNDPNVMDIKMGSRTFLESEVKNPVLRKDLYEKMCRLSPTEPTAEEHERRSITKLRYMQFREKQSSTSVLGFRIEAIRMAGESTNRDLKTVKKYTEVATEQTNQNLKKINTRQQVKRTIARFLAGDEISQLRLIERLREMRAKFELSNFFKSHEVIGSSVLVMYDVQHKASAWMIDFAKTLPVEKKQVLNHRTPWQVGNHEDGYLFGLDNLISILEDIDFKEDYVNQHQVQINS